jgi:hypothetical protein
MMKRTNFLLLAILLSAVVSAQNPFESLKYDKVVIYDYEGSKGRETDVLIVDKNGKLNPQVKKQATLNITEGKDLASRLGLKKSYGGGSAACFDPHLGVVFYYKDKIVRFVSVCMDCNRLQADVDIPAQKQNKVGKGEQAYYIGEGMSDPFRSYLNALLKKYDFSHQIKK